MVKRMAESQVKASSSASPKSSFAVVSSNIPNRQAIALISVHGDPAAEIGKEAAGGQNVYVRQVGEALAKLGWQVDLFTRKVHPDDPAIVQHSPYCRTIRLVAGPQEYIPRDQLFPYLPEFVDALCKFQTKESTSYPLVHTNYWLSGWVGLQLQQLCNVQLVHTYHSLGAVKYATTADLPEIAQTRLAVEREILESADRVVATSPQEEEHMRSFVSQQGNIGIIPCGTDIDNFHRMPQSEARQKLGFSPEEKIVLYVGRFDPRKGIETLVKACGQLDSCSDGAQLSLDNLRLVIVGGSESNQADGQERQRIEQLVQSVGMSDRTVFAGRIGHDLLPFYYTAADVCAIPSHYEPFGLVAIESMACGTPVVASNVGGLKFTVVPEETGLLVPPQDDAAFAEAIGRILSNPGWATKLREQASTRVQQKFSWTGVGAQLSDLYRRLLAESLMHKPTQKVQPLRSRDPIDVAPARSVSPLTKVS